MRTTLAVGLTMWLSFYSADAAAQDVTPAGALAVYAQDPNTVVLNFNDTISWFFNGASNASAPIPALPVWGRAAFALLLLGAGVRRILRAG
jgi:hypothetical protein